MVLKADGELTKGPEKVIDHWYEYLISIQSIYDEDATYHGRAGDCLVQLKTRKAGSLLFISLELILFSGSVL